MENNEKKNSMLKLWPLWLIIIVIAIIAVMNMKKDGVVPTAETEQAAQTMQTTELSGKALSMVDKDQYFLPKWFGKKCPDFSVTTIEGKEITLSSLSGKQVMFVFWATWCPPCRKEIPHIIELRDAIGADKLEIIGFSSEKTETVKDFVANKGINYNIATGSTQQLPEPFNRVMALPTIFFIDAEGKLKLAIEGGISFEQMKGIVEAN